ncbi:MAG: hypothetical protein AABZ66_01850, partial [Candidatus Binatota bacterium]
IRSWLFTVDSGKGRFRRRESLFGSAANNPERKTRLEREIEATDRRIDQLVYSEAFSCRINTTLLNFSVSFK